LAAALVGAGCVKVNTDPGTDREPSIGAHVARGKEKRSLENDIRQLAQLMMTYYTESGKPPRSWEDFKSYIQRDAPHIVREIDGGQIRVLWGTPMDSSHIIAYEVEPDLRNSHVVAHGDASVVTLTSGDLTAALRNQGVQ
jgi:hypothetical protein